MNMKKKALSAAIVGALGIGSAHAVSLSTDGSGEVAIVPYWTTMADAGVNSVDPNDFLKTNLSIVNTTGETKAVKVRFIEALNSQEVFDFNLYLSEYDVWTASLVYYDPEVDSEMYANELASEVFGPAGGVAGTRIVTNDNSCTAPDISTNVYTFSPVLFGTTGGDRLRSGYIEIIEMGQVLDADAISAITHKSDGEPGDCGAVIAANKNNRFSGSGTGFWDQSEAYNDYDDFRPDGQRDVGEPTGGLVASASIIQVNDGYEIPVPVTHLENFSNVARHAAPSDVAPDLQEVSPPISVVVTNDNDGTQTWVDDWSAPDATFGSTYNQLHDRPVDAVSALFMTKSVNNEYTLNPAVNAETSWVVTFPTKRYYVTAEGMAREPFSSLWSSSLNRACEPAAFDVWDREEAQEDTLVLPSPQVGTSAGDLALCYEANVINFNYDDVELGQSDVLNATLNKSSLGVKYKNGWAQLVFDHNAHFLHNQTSGRVYEGLPAIGFRATILKNPNISDNGGYYGGAHVHNYERIMSFSSTYDVWLDANNNDEIDAGEYGDDNGTLLGAPQGRYVETIEIDPASGREIPVITPVVIPSWDSNWGDMSGT